MLRSLIKVASTASAAATTAVVSVSSVAAHAEFPTKKYRESAHSRLAKPYPGSQHIDDEYDFCQEETHVAFIGGVPSQEEVDDATKDLQASFVQNEGFRSSTVLKRIACENETFADAEVVPLVSKDQAAEYRDLSGPTLEVTPSPTEIVESSPSVRSHLQTLAVGGTNNVIARCVDLLQRDPDIQAAVISLARDPAIWDAFVKNEKVRELLQGRDLSLPNLEGSSVEDPRSYKEGGENPFVGAFVRVKNLVIEMMDSILGVVSNVFGFVDQKLFGGKESDLLDKPLKACMVLTILILALVVLKRVR